MTIRSVVRAGLGGLVLTLSISLTAPFAQAAPPATPAPTTQAVSGSTTYKQNTTTTGANGEKVLRAARVVQYSPNRKKRHLDWAQAKKQFGDHTTWRDDFAAGYIGGGGYLDNAAQSTKDRLKKRWQSMVDSGARVPEASAQRGGTNCTGVTKDVAYSKSTGYSEVWLNSCDTNTLIARYASATALLGFLTARAPGWYSAIPGIFVTVTTIKAANLTAAKSNSRVGAVIYRYTRVARVGGSGLVDGQVRIESSLRSQ